MRKPVHFWSLLLLAVGCAGLSKITDTPSGWPEVAIEGVELESVGNAVVNEFQSLGYRLEEQSKNSLLLTKELEGGQAFAAQPTIGNAYSTTPKAEVRFTLSKVVKVDEAGTVIDCVRVIALGSISTQMAMGQTRREDMKNNNRWFNDLQYILMRVQAVLEGKPIPELPPKPAKPSMEPASN